MNMLSRRWLLLVLLWSPVAWSAAPAQGSLASHPDGAAIASGHHLATEAGMEILAKGGNAFDAAVAVSSTLAVVEPISSGLGGGGFFLLREAGAQPTYRFLDARERAPLAAHVDLYRRDGEVQKHLSLNGPLAAAIPGLPAALATYALIGWLLGTQNARGPLAILLTTNLLNVGLDLLFVLGLDWGVAGAAWACSSGGRQCSTICSMLMRDACTLMAMAATVSPT